jgi:hypothetical protein
LIKPKDLNPVHEQLWPLMMKNVYFLGDTSFAVQGFNISVRKKNEHDSVQDVNSRKNFINLLGLDVTDSNGKFVKNGDSQVDSTFNHYFS